MKRREAIGAALIAVLLASPVWITLAAYALEGRFW